MPSFKSHHQKRRTPSFGLFIKVFLALVVILMIWFLSKEMMKRVKDKQQHESISYFHSKQATVFGVDSLTFSVETSAEEISISNLRGRGYLINQNPIQTIQWFNEGGRFVFSPGRFGLYSNQNKSQIRVIEGEVILQPGEAEIRYPSGSFIEIRPEEDHFRILEISRN